MGCNAKRPIFVGLNACVTAHPETRHKGVLSILYYLYIVYRVYTLRICNTIRGNASRTVPLLAISGNAVTQAFETSFYGLLALPPGFWAKVTQ